jgi:hypothetical protein
VVHCRIHLQSAKLALHTVLFSTKKKIHTLLGIVLGKVSSQSIKLQSCENKVSQIHDITGKEKR